jgi:hypothetical protein
MEKDERKSDSLGSPGFHELHCKLNRYPETFRICPGHEDFPSTDKVLREVESTNVRLRIPFASHSPIERKLTASSDVWEL